MNYRREHEIFLTFSIWGRLEFLVKWNARDVTIQHLISDQFLYACKNKIKIIRKNMIKN
jgi:hypothetical protein